MGMPMGNTSKNGLGTWALVLGILSIVCCGFLSGIPAIILGIQSKNAQEQGLASNGNIGNIGFILGIIGTALSAVSLVLNALGVFAFDWSSYSS
jgi:hypothetical protein